MRQDFVGISGRPPLAAVVLERADQLDEEGDHEQARHWRGLILREEL